MWCWELWFVYEFDVENAIEECEDDKGDEEESENDEGEDID